MNLTYDPIADNIYEAIKYSSFILVNGHPSVGKTTLVKYLLKEYNQDNYAYSYTLCETLQNNTELFTQILRDLCKSLGIKNSIGKTVTQWDFVTNISELSKKAGSRKLVVVLDRPERMPMRNSLTIISSIQELNIILISTQSKYEILNQCFDSFTTKASIQTRMAEFTVDVWSKNDLIEQICKHPPRIHGHLYRKIVNNIVHSVYNNRTKEFIELKSICQDRFASFPEYYKEEIRRIIRSDEENLVLTDEQLEAKCDKYNMRPAEENNIVLSFNKIFNKSTIDNSVLDEQKVKNTSINMSSLIVAAYIAGHSKHSDDKKNFLSSRRRKFIRKITENNHNNPKQFSMERLLHIQRALEDKKDIKREICGVDIMNLKLLEREKLIRVSKSVAQGLETSTQYKISKIITGNYIERMVKHLELGSLKDFYGLWET